MTADPRAAWNAVERLALSGERDLRLLARDLADVLMSAQVRTAMDQMAEDTCGSGSLRAAHEAAEAAFVAGARPEHVEARGHWEETHEHLPAPLGVTHLRVWRRNRTQRRLEVRQVRFGPRSMETGWCGDRQDHDAPPPNAALWKRVREGSDS